MKHWILFLLLCYLLIPAGAVNASTQTAASWSKQANFPGGVLEKGVAFSIGNKAFAGLGTDLKHFQKGFWKYSADKDLWEEAEKFPSDARISAVAFSIGNKGYVGTGMVGTAYSKDGTNDFWEYDPEKNSWSQKANFPGEMRAAATGFAIDTKGYIALGANQNAFYNDLWEYDPASNQWSKKADFPEKGRVDASVFVIGKEAYIIFGQKKEIFPSKKKSWKYSQAKNEWAPFADFPGSARIGSIVFSYKNKGYALAGTSGSVKRFQDFWEYDSEKDKWLAKEDVPFGASAYGFSFLIKNSVYVSTGKTQAGTMGSEIWKYSFPADVEKKSAPVVDKFAMGGSLLLGENRIPLASVEVKILNRKNEIVKTVTTGLFGSFLFMDLPNDQEYTLVVDVPDRQWRTQKIYLVNRENEAMATLDAANEFKFHISMQEKGKLQLLKIENKNMRMDMRGKLILNDEKKRPLTDVEVTLINNQEEVVQGTTTDQKGNFVFNYLPVDTNLYLTLDEKAITALPKGTTVLLMDQHETVVDKTTPTSSKFLLVSLPPEQNKLSTIYIEDPWMEAAFGNLKEGLLVVKNIYFEVGKWDLEPNAKAELNKVVVVMKNNNKVSIEIAAHTDSRGDAKSNLVLSEKRAQEAKKYMVSQGVDDKRITAKGFGETKLLNQCKDGVDCTEEEHAKNRRMEFTIKQK
ncbi:MAG: OmpA family protein [Bacteroidia bacterium]